MNYVSSICLIETFLLMKLNTLFYHYNNLFAFVQKEHQPNAIHCKMTENERWAKYCPNCNTITLQELIKIAQFHFNVMALYANVERFLPYHIELRREMFSSLDKVIEELTLRYQQLHALAEKCAFLTPLNLLDDKYVSNRSQSRRLR